ncbi:MAG: hypothetical protein U1D30_21115 [Planctomycetota bacterium]
MMTADYSLLSVERLPLGYSLRRPILETASDAELLPAGTEISLSLIQSLINQGDVKVRVHREEVELFKLPAVLWKEGVLDPRNWNHSPSALLQFVRVNLPKNQSVANERRQFPRYPFTTRVLGIALNERFEKCGPVFEAVSRDISATGIALCHTRSISERYLLIDLSMPSGRQTRFIIERTRCQTAGRFYLIAGKFVAKYDRTESSTTDRNPLLQVSLQTKKRAYLQLLLAQERAEQEAQRRFPREDSRTSREEFARRRFALRRETIEKVFRLSARQMDETIEEGNDEEWCPSKYIDLANEITTEPTRKPR